MKRCFIKKPVAHIAVALFVISCGGACAQQPPAWFPDAERAHQLESTDFVEADKCWRRVYNAVDGQKAPDQMSMLAYMFYGGFLKDWNCTADALAVYQRGLKRSQELNYLDRCARFQQCVTDIEHTLYQEGGSKPDPELLVKAMALYPYVSGQNDDFYVDAYKTLGDAYSDNGKYAEASENLEKSIQTEATARIKKYYEIRHSQFDNLLTQKKFKETSELFIDHYPDSEDGSEGWYQLSAAFRESVDRASGVSDVETKLKQLMTDKNWDELEKLALASAESKSTLPTGFWEADGLSFVLEPARGHQCERKWNETLELLHAWIDARPNSSVAKIMLANALVGYAWAGRTDQMANDVTSDQMEAVRKTTE